jgi:hypothetical protein
MEARRNSIRRSTLKAIDDNFDAEDLDREVVLTT